MPIPGPATCDASVCGLNTDIEPKLNLVRAGVNYHFWGGDLW